MNDRAIANNSIERPGILLVENDAGTLEMLVEAIVRRFDANITCASCAEDALAADEPAPHDLVVASVNLPGMHGLELLDRLMQRRRRPVILLTLRPTSEQAIEALRLRAADLLVKPFDLRALLQRMEQELREYQQARRHWRRSQRVRRLVRGALRERRALRERLDFVCRDLVGAHQRLLNHMLAGPDRHDG
ncbi:MAG: response regulator [Planctomycetes bacterium]|nr:response regulator [Planctomycetota bacterium]